MTTIIYVCIDKAVHVPSECKHEILFSYYYVHKRTWLNVESLIPNEI